MYHFELSHDIGCVSPREAGKYGIALGVTPRQPAHAETFFALSPFSKSLLPWATRAGSPGVPGGGGCEAKECAKPPIRESGTVPAILHILNL